jgi:hypothetical protein
MVEILKNMKNLELDSVPHWQPVKIHERRCYLVEARHQANNEEKKHLNLTKWVNSLIHVGFADWRIEITRGE